MVDFDISQFDSTIHSPVRMAILSILLSSLEASFSYLKKAIGTTDGNLSTHLTRLEKSQLITIKKSFSGRKPLTTCTITPQGRKKFEQYIQTIEKIIKLSRQRK